METIKLTNCADLDILRRGMITAEQVRTTSIEALVDTGATMLAIPADVAEKLGLEPLGMRTVRYADGSVANVAWVGPIRVEILGREMHCDALVLPAGTTALIGQLPLEGLDLVVDPKSRSLAVNPASPDTPLMDLLRAQTAA